MPSSPTPLHIGIVACSAEGAALCYRTICRAGADMLGEHAHPEVSMHTPSLASYLSCLEQTDMGGVADLMLSSARKLAQAGADFLICPDNTIHAAFEQVAPHSPLPWLHIADVVAAEAQKRGHRRVGLVGTQWLVDSEVYPQKLTARGLQCVKPGAAERAKLNRIIVDELVNGEFRAPSIAWLQQLIASLQRQGCDTVALACTELPLVISDANSPLPTLDSTRLLALAALKRAVEAAP
jgi:aspartate racemase